MSLVITEAVLVRLTAKYWHHVIKRRGCWGWRGTTRSGYGRMCISVDGKAFAIDAHRVSWLIHFGDIPEGLFVLHECDDPPCSKPSCLFLGTQQSNVDDMRAKGRGRYVPLFGSANGKSKGAFELVERVRCMSAERVTQRDIAAAFNISQSTVWRWVHGATRKAA